jgi:hypothetical protein
MFWQISSFPRCRHHAFLSHCAIDRPNLVYPVFEELKRRAIVPWLDRDDYYYGRGSRAALRDGLLLSRHIVFFVTIGMLKYSRGWCPMELAYSDLLQANLLHLGGPLLNYERPLFFLDQADTELPRTVWNQLRDRGIFHHPSNGNPVNWAVNQITAFLQREQLLAMNLATALTPGEPNHDAVIGRLGLVDRVTQFHPSPIHPDPAFV